MPLKLNNSSMAFMNFMNRVLILVEQGYDAIYYQVFGIYSKAKIKYHYSVTPRTQWDATPARITGRDP